MITLINKFKKYLKITILSNVLYFENKWVYTLLWLFSSVLLMLAIQDIAVDGWWVTMVKEENLSNAATAQIIGIRTGSFLSYSLYFALNSVEFWNNYIYFTKQSEPILNESNYLMYGAFFIFAISLYTLIFSNEKNDRIQFEDHHEIFSIIENLKICFKLLQNEQVIILILFFLCETLFWSFQLRFGDIILLNELKYSQEKFSIIQILE